MPLPPSATAFDEAAGQLIGAIVDGSIITIEISTGEIVSQVETTTTAEPIEVGIRPDGLIVLVSPGQVEIVDRLTGPTGLSVELRNIDFARVRHDGSLLTTTADERTDILDLEGNGLVARSWDVDDAPIVTFNAGMAAASEWPFPGAEIVDLATGVRSTLELELPDGVRLITQVVYPKHDGAWAVDDDGAILRWEGGQMVERVDPDYDFDFGARYLDTWAALSIFGDEEDEMGLATLVNLERDNAGVLFEVPVAGDSAVVHPTLEGGMHVLGESGTLSTYDSDGRLVAEVNTPAERPYWITMDPHSGKLAVAAQLGVTVEFAPVSRSVMIIDPKTGETEQVPGFDLIWNLGFARDGELLAITNVDGNGASLGRRTRRFRGPRLGRIRRTATRLALVVRRGDRIDVGGVVRQALADTRRPRTLDRTGMQDRRPRPHPGRVGSVRSRRWTRAVRLRNVDIVRRRWWGEVMGEPVPPVAAAHRYQVSARARPFR